MHTSHLLRLSIFALAKHRNAGTLAPVNKKRFADQEEHDRDLSNAEEAPDRGLLHKIVRDQGSHDGTEQEEENSLNDHPLLFIQGKEWCKHEE